MLNLPETLSLSLPYPYQNSEILKFFGFFIGGIVFLDFIRFQVSEITLLQLVPGIYFSLLLTSFGSFLFFSWAILKVIRGNDWVKRGGTRLVVRIFVRQIIFFSAQYVVKAFLLLFNAITPLSFESFSLFFSATFVNFWELNEFFNLESSLGTYIYILFQFPLFVIGPEYSAIDFSLARVFTRDYLFSLTVIGGLFSPTLDVITQINFILIGVVFYFAISSFLKKIILRRRIVHL
jgi:hypothetical protein